MLTTLTAADITRLIAQGGIKRRSTGNPRNWYIDSNGVKHTGKPPAALVGAFTGRVGTVRRSRKGRTSRMPNGSRKYVQDWQDTVLAYKVTP